MKLLWPMLLFSVLALAHPCFAEPERSRCETSVSRHRTAIRALVLTTVLTGLGFALEPAAEAALQAHIAVETDFALQLWSRNFAWAQHRQADLVRLDHFLHNHVLPKPLGSPLSQDAWRNVNLVYLVDRALIQSVTGTSTTGQLNSPMRNGALTQIEQDPFAIFLIQLHKDQVLPLAEMIRYLDLGVARSFALMSLHLHELPTPEAQADFLVRHQNQWVEEIANQRLRGR